MSSKKCPKCQSKTLVLIASQYHKICSDCGHKIEWRLDKDQKPLVPNNRVKVTE